MLPIFLRFFFWLFLGAMARPISPTFQPLPTLPPKIRDRLRDSDLPFYPCNNKIIS